MKQNLSQKQLLALHRGFFILGDSASLKILYELERYGEKTFSHLRDELGINPATLTKKLRMLTEAGLVSADRTHDHLHVYYAIAQYHRPIKKFLDSFEKLCNEI